jgi:hypothetical protein
MAKLETLKEFSDQSILLASVKTRVPWKPSKMERSHRALQDRNQAGTGVRKAEFVWLLKIRLIRSTRSLDNFLQIYPA